MFFLKLLDGRLLFIFTVPSTTSDNNNYVSTAIGILNEYQLLYYYYSIAIYSTEYLAIITN